jgi:hypothetical protein
MLPDYEPQLAGDYWVLPTIDHASGGVVRLQLIGVNQFARYVSATPTTIGPSTSP